MPTDARICAPTTRTGTPRALLPAGMAELLRIANGGTVPADVGGRAATNVLQRLAASGGAAVASASGAAASSAATTSLHTADAAAVAAAGGAGSDAAASASPTGFWPRVHAFNCLRMAFLDRTLATDASGFFAEGIQAAISALAAPQWEVRNAASLCFVALLTRVLGFMNVQTKAACCKRMPTGAEFFVRCVGRSGGLRLLPTPVALVTSRGSSLHLMPSLQLRSGRAGELNNICKWFLSDAWGASLMTRTLHHTSGGAHIGWSSSDDSHDTMTVFLLLIFRYPSLHPFLLEQLEAAAAQLEAAPSGAVHPALYPALVILSRLRPSPLLRDDARSGPLSPAAFAPAVQR